MAPAGGPSGAPRASWSIFLVAVTTIQLIWPVCGQEGVDYSRNGLLPPFQTADGSLRMSGWRWSGSTRIEKDVVSLTPAQPNRRGSLWSSVPLVSPGWEMELDLRVTGHEAPSTGEGLALWIVRDMPSESDMEGPLFGGRLAFRGLGLFFDSLDDDEDGNNPSVSAMLSDGHQLYDKANDGWNSQIAGCIAPYRNSREPVAVRVELVPPPEHEPHGLPSLVVLVRTDDTVTSASASRPGFETCFSVPQVDMQPGEYYVGLTALNDRFGGSSLDGRGARLDAVDILGLYVFSYQAPEHEVQLARPDPEKEAGPVGTPELPVVLQGKDVLSREAKTLAEAAREFRRRKEAVARASGKRFLVHAEAVARLPGEEDPEGQQLLQERDVVQDRGSVQAEADGASSKKERALAAGELGDGMDSLMEHVLMHQAHVVQELTGMARAQKERSDRLQESVGALHRLLAGVDSALRGLSGDIAPRDTAPGAASVSRDEQQALVRGLRDLRESSAAIQLAVKQSREDQTTSLRDVRKLLEQLVNRVQLIQEEGAGGAAGGVDRCSNKCAAAVRATVNEVTGPSVERAVSRALGEVGSHDGPKLSAAAVVAAGASTSWLVYGMLALNLVLLLVLLSRSGRSKLYDKLP